MLRKLMGGMIALMLVATLLLPVASVGAQEEEIDASQALVTTEETIPEAESQPVEEEPPVVEPQPEAPVVEEPVTEEPVVEEPIVEEPVIEEPVEEPRFEEPVSKPDDVDPEETAEQVEGEESGATDDGTTEEAEENTPDDPVDGAAVATVISSASLDCDGTLSFTITEAADETLGIQFTDLHAPSIHQDMGAVSFTVTGTGTFQVSIGVDSWVDVFQADISSPLAGGVIEQAAAYGCVSGEEQTLGGISNMTLSCAGVTTFDVGLIDGSVSINLYDDSTNPQTIIASESLGHIIDGGGQGQSVDFAIPAGIYDSLVVRAYAHNNWAALDIAYASGCIDDDPELPEVQNLTVDCTGLVTFDLETSEPVVLDVSIFIPAAAPGYRDTLQLSAESGPQQVQFDLPVQPYEWATSVSLGAEWLADAIVQGCPMQPLNTLPGSDVTVPVAGGTVTFENVLEPGQTYVQQLDPEFAPPLPAEYQDGLVIMIELSTSAVFSGSTEICLPIVGEVADDAENVRLLHFENGAWVDITTFASAADGVVCGVTSSFSPFAIIRMSGDVPVDPGKPVEPGKPIDPEKPVHQGKPGGATSQASGTTASSSANPTTLPITGGGAHPAHSGTETIQLMLGALALIAAAGLRVSTTRARSTQSR